MTRKMEKSGSGSVLRKMGAINKARVDKTDAVFVFVQLYLSLCTCAEEDGKNHRIQSEAVFRMNTIFLFVYLCLYLKGAEASNKSKVYSYLYLSIYVCI